MLHCCHLREVGFGINLEDGKKLIRCQGRKVFGVKVHLERRQK
jgi:hypothetical protein